jgi:hypothetical protein
MDQRPAFKVVVMSMGREKKKRKSKEQKGFYRRAVFESMIGYALNQMSVCDMYILLFDNREE